MHYKQLERQNKLPRARKRKRKEEERKIKIDEELKKQEAEKIKPTQVVTEQLASDAAYSQAQNLEKPDIQYLEAPTSSRPG